MSEEIFNAARDAASGGTPQQALPVGRDPATGLVEDREIPDAFVTPSGVFSVDVAKGLVAVQNSTLNPHKLAEDTADAMTAVLRWVNELFDTQAASEKPPLA